MPLRRLALLFTLGLAWTWTSAGRAEGPIAADQFDELSRLIKPQPGESRWAAIPWVTNLKEARERAVAEDRPLLVWRSGGGDVLGRT
jgi:hypothetical protein